MKTPTGLGRNRRLALDLTIAVAVLLMAGYALASEPAKTLKASYAPLQSQSSLTIRIELPDSSNGTDTTGAGQVRFGLYDSREAYAQDREMIARTVGVSHGRAHIPLKGLRPGRYAFRLYHDRNGNGALDTGPFGIPTEPYFFSNDASDMFSAPEWEEASFRLSEGDYAYEVTLD